MKLIYKEVDYLHKFSLVVTEILDAYEVLNLLQGFVLVLFDLDLVDLVLQDLLPLLYFIFEFPWLDLLRIKLGVPISLLGYLLYLFLQLIGDEDVILFTRILLGIGTIVE